MIIYKCPILLLCNHTLFILIRQSQKNYTKNNLFIGYLSAGAEGDAPSSTVLETVILLLNYAPIRNKLRFRTFVFLRSSYPFTWFPYDWCVFCRSCNTYSIPIFPSKVSYFFGKNNWYVYIQHTQILSCFLFLLTA